MSVGLGENLETNRLRLNPTMIVGLGGTGKEVLLRIRRLFYERKGLNPDNTIGYPIIGYLLVDTDTANVDTIDKESLTPFVQQNIALRAANGVPQFIHAQVRENEFNGYFAGGNHFPHVARWLLPELNRYGAVAITNGAGQNRPFGRLAFFHNYRGVNQRPGIRDTLTSRLREILANAAIPQLVERYRTEGMEVDSKTLDVILVYSLAGGTGAGMFLDMGMMVRDVVSEINIAGLSPHFTHIAMLPEAFVKDTHVVSGLSPIQQKDLREKIQENAYAALREMEYFSMRRGANVDLTIPDPVPTSANGGEVGHAPLYTAEWEERRPVVVRDCPWDTCYLVGGGNDTMNGSVLPPSEIYQMISEYIFLDFDPSDFGATKRSLRSNLQEVTLSVFEDEIKDELGRVLYRRPLSRRFRAFGLSQIYFDRERMRRAASYRLAQKLIDEHWLRPSPLDPVGLGKAAQEDLEGGAEGSKHVVTRTLLPADVQVRMTWPSTRDRLLRVDETSSTWFEEIRVDYEATSKDVRSGKVEHRSGAPIQQFQARHEGRLADPRAMAGERGRAIRSFKGQQDQLEAEIAARLACLFHFRVDREGARGAGLLFREYSAKIGGEAAAAEAKAQEPPPAAAPWADRLEEARGLPIRFYAEYAAMAEAMKGLADVRTQLGLRYQREVAPLARETLSRAATATAEQPAEGESYARSLKKFVNAVDVGIRPYLTQRFEELNQPKPGVGRTEGLFADIDVLTYDKMIASCPAIAARNREARRGAMNWPAIEEAVLENLREQHARYRSATGLGGLVLQLCPLKDGAAPNEARVNEFARNLAEACEALLDGFAADRTALGQYQLEDEARHTQILDQFRKHSSPYLCRASSNNAGQADTHLSVYLGISDTSPDIEKRQFKQDVVNPPRRGDMQAVLAGLRDVNMKDDALVLYQEKVGVPLCYYQGLEELASLYNASRRIKETHFDFHLEDRLPEIRMVDPTRQRVLGEVLQNILYGIITRRISYENGAYRLSRDLGGGEISFEIGTRFQQLTNYLAEETSRQDRQKLAERMERWFEHAMDGDGGQLAALWCALQYLNEELRRRVQWRINREGTAAGNQQWSDHPLLSVVSKRMIPAVRDRLAGHPRGADYLGSDLDWVATATDERVERSIREGRWQAWNAQAKTLFEGLAEGCIPILKHEARVDTPNGRSASRPNGTARAESPGVDGTQAAYVDY